MTRAPRSPALPRPAIGVLAATLALAIASQLLALTRGQAPQAGVSAVVDAGPPLDAGLAAGADERSADAASLDRIRADVAFWSARVEKQPADFVSATEWAAAEIEFARATGDPGAWQRAEAATARALEGNPDYTPALAHRGAALLALHRFTHARDLARSVLDRRPTDAPALATLGDASLDLGDYLAARGAYEELDRVARSAASRVRLARLAWIEGRPDEAVALATEALAAALEEGAAGERLAWYRITLGDLLGGSGRPAEARDAFEDALEADPGSWQARFAIARLDAAEGRIDMAIAHLDAAIAAVPQPESLARRADLYELRGEPGDARRAADDRATVEAIAALAGDDTLYDRTLVLYLANHGLQPERAVRMAQAELELRRDVHGHDALAWALLAAGRPAEADASMQLALATGTREAGLLYHAGMIAAARDDPHRARTLLAEALALDPSFDPLQAARARQTLADLP